MYNTRAGPGSGGGKEGFGAVADGGWKRKREERETEHGKVWGEG